MLITPLEPYKNYSGCKILQWCLNKVIQDANYSTVDLMQTTKDANYSTGALKITHNANYSIGPK